MMPSAVLMVEKLKGTGFINKAAQHNKRAQQAELGARQHIDAGLSHCNASLHGLATPAEIAGYARERMEAAGVGKLRKDAVRAIEWVFSLPAGHGIDEDAYFRDAMLWVAAQSGGLDNVLCADIHRDEAQPHCHVIVLPLIDGRMVGSDLLGGRAKLAALKNDFHAKVAKGYGLRREAGKLQGAMKHEAVHMVLDRLKQSADAALDSRAWQAIREAVLANPRPFLLALGLDEPQRKLRTMAQVFTSQGKGAKKEPRMNNNPIGFANSEPTQAVQENLEPYAL
jgi:Plasmid recombination enzyme